MLKSRQHSVDEINRCCLSCDIIYVKCCLTQSPSSSLYLMYSCTTWIRGSGESKLDLALHLDMEFEISSLLYMPLYLVHNATLVWVLSIDATRHGITFFWHHHFVTYTTDTPLEIDSPDYTFIWQFNRGLQVVRCRQWRLHNTRRDVQHCRCHLPNVGIGSWS